MQLFKLIIKTFYRDITVKGTENLPPSGPLIFTPNHPNSLLDPLLMLSFPKKYPIRFVAKAPLFKITMLGWIMRQIKAIPVIRRFEAEGVIDYKTFFASCLDALAAGESMVIFPEGQSLPQSHMAPLKTGTARLFFLAFENGINVKIIPVGLNYEHGSIFRSSVLISIAPPVNTDPFIELYKGSPYDAVNQLTVEIGLKLNEHVFQSENYQDRQLMILLEQIIREKQYSTSWPERFERLKLFEKGLSILRKSSSLEIEQLRSLLIQYKRLSDAFKKGYPISVPKGAYKFKGLILALSGFPFVVLGYLFNIIPFKLCNIIVYSFQKADEAVIATYKVVYSLLLFPFFYLAECLLIYELSGWVASISFAVVILPLSYFTIFFYEWFNDNRPGILIPTNRLKKILSNMIIKQLDDLRAQINQKMDILISRFRMELEKQSGG